MQCCVLRPPQEHERNKLRLTLALQALKAAHAQQRFRCFYAAAFSHAHTHLPPTPTHTHLSDPPTLLPLLLNCSWQHEEAAAAALASLPAGAVDLLQGHLCGIGCVHQTPTDEPTHVRSAATSFPCRWRLLSCASHLSYATFCNILVSLSQTHHPTPTVAQTPHSRRLNTRPR